MALINCPECDKKISDQAEKCPNCAFPIKKTTQVVLESKEGCFLRTLNTGCMIIFVLIATIIGIGIIATILD